MFQFPSRLFLSTSRLQYQPAALSMSCISRLSEKKFLLLYPVILTHPQLCSPSSSSSTTRKSLTIPSDTSSHTFSNHCSYVDLEAAIEKSVPPSTPIRDYSPATAPLSEHLAGVKQLRSENGEWRSEDRYPFSSAFERCCGCSWCPKVSMSPHYIAGP